MNFKKWVLVSLAICFFYLFILQLIAVWPFTIDDMYISLRYAKNWAKGYGLVWNIGEEPVEGYSNFSFVVLAASTIRLGFDPVIVLKAVNAFSLLLSTAAIYCLTRLWFPRWLALIPCLWLLTYRGELLWAVSGLETIFYQALISFSLFFLLRGIGYDVYPNQRAKPKILFLLSAGFLLGLAGLTRPEAPALMILFAALALLDSPKVERVEYYKKLSWGFFICLLIFLPYFSWRWIYYGRLFPNPVYCKAFSNFFALADLRYLSLAFPLLILSLPGIFKAEDKRHYYFWLPSFVYLAFLINADPVSAFENRLFLPVFALLLPLAFLGLARLLDYFLPKKDEIYYAGLIIGAFWFAFLFLQPLSLANYRSFTINPQVGIHLRGELLVWLEKNVPSKSSVFLADSGQIPYHSSLRYIDSYCLNNKAMTSNLNINMYQAMCDEVFIKKPEVLILTSLLNCKGEEIFYAPADACVKNRLTHDKTYLFRKIFQTDCRDFAYRYEIYTLRN
ncbi:MAG: protein LphB [Tatlockia sp.]|nr:protein LphB [Tatlockia sp.]